MSVDAVNLLDPEILRDPYPLYARLRREYPVCPLKGGGYLLTRYEDVKSALANRRLRNAPSRFSVLHGSKAGRYEAARMARNILPFQDAPDHPANRRHVFEAFAPSARRVSDRLPELAEEVLSDLERGTAFDVVADYGRPFSVAVMLALLDFDRHDEAALTSGADAFFRLFAPIPDAVTLTVVNAELSALRGAVRDIVERQLRSSADSFASALADRSSRGAGPDAETIADTCILLFADGIENVQFAIAMAWATISDQPDLLARTENEDGALQALVMEVLRLHSPAQSIPRIVDESVTLRGVALKRDMPVHLSLGSANRDETVFAEPDRLIVAPGSGREKAIPFGAGRHSCIGGRLATSMIVAAVDALRRLRAVPIDNVETIEFLPRFAHRWPRAVKAAFPPA